jgi:hypothetical protein
MEGSKWIHLYITKSNNPNATALNSGQYSCSIIGTGGCDDTKVDVIIGDIEALFLTLQLFL